MSSPTNRLKQDQPQYTESQRYQQEKKRREEERIYEEELAKYEAEKIERERKAQEYNRSTTLPRNEQIVNVAVRERETGKLVAVYSTPRGKGSMIPDSIGLQFSAFTEEQINEAKKNPNYAGVEPNPEKYVQNMIIPSTSDKEVAETKLVGLEKEIQTSGVKDFIYHGGDYEKYNTVVQTRIDASQNITSGGKDNRQIDWSRLSKEQLAVELEKQKQVAESQKTLTPPEIWSTTREYAQQRAAGFSTTGLTLVDESGKPIQPVRGTKEAVIPYNKQIIESQKQILYPQKQTQQGIPQSESISQPSYLGIKEGKGTETEPFKGKQPDRSLVSPYLGATYWTAPGTEKTFTTKSDADAYLRKPPEIQWTVGDKTFKSKESAEKYIQRTQKSEGSFIGFSPEGKPVQGAPAPVWTVENLNPATKERFPTRTFRTEAEAIAYQTKFGKSNLPVGTLQYQYGQTPKDPFKSMIEKAYNRASEIQDENMKKGILGQIANVPLEAGRSVLGFGATVINLSEQYVDPYVEKTLNLKTPVKTAPIYLTDETAAQTQLSYDLKYTPEQNVKRWAGLQAQYIEKKGLPAYLVGGLENYYLVRGGVGAVKAGLSLVPRVGSKIVKPLLPRIGGAAKSAAIQGAPSKIFKGESRFASPSKTWDVAEKVSPVGFRKTIPSKSFPIPVKKGIKPVPNPYGKERKIPYTIRQGTTKVSEYVKTIPSRMSAQLPPRPQTPNVLLRAGVLASRIIDVEQSRVRKARESFNRWNESGRTESPIPQGTKIRNTRLERMRNLMWPEIVETSKPRSTRPPIGYKAKLSAELYLKNTKQNVRENIKVLSEGSKDAVNKIINPIKKDQKFPNKSLSRIHLGKKTQLPKLEGMTPPKGLVKFVRKADVSALAIKQKAKTKITQAKKDFNIMRNLFYVEPEKKIVVPFKTKQELKNMIREDVGFTQDFVSRQKTKESIPDFIRMVREEERVRQKRSYNINLKKETLPERIQKSSTKQVKARREPPIELPERTVIPRLKYKETKLIDKILSGLGKPKEFKGEYMPRSKGKSKPNRNIFIEDNAKESQDFLDTMKSEKSSSKEFAEEFREDKPVLGLRKDYFEKKSIESKARNLELKKEEDILSKKERETSIEKLKGKEPKGIREFVKEGEKRKSFVERMREEKKMELPERSVSIFKVPYKETKLDKMLNELGKKKKIYYKKTDTTSETYTQSRPKIIRDKEEGIVNKNQILLKPELKKKLETKLESPTPQPQEEVSGISAPMKEKKTTPLIIPPMPKEEKRRKPVEQATYLAYEVPLHADRPKISPRSMTGSTLAISTRTVVTPRTNTRSIQGYKQVQPLTIKRSEKLSDKSKQKLFSVQTTKISQKQESPQKQTPKQKERTLTRMPTPQRPKSVQKPVFRQKQPTRLALRTPEPMRPRKRIIPILPPIDLKRKKKGRKGKSSKTTVFLGSSTTDRIVGLFRREGSSDIITGEKRVAKQLKKDIRSKPSAGLGFSGKKLKL